MAGNKEKFEWVGDKKYPSLAPAGKGTYRVIWYDPDKGPLSKIITEKEALDSGLQVAKNANLASSVANPVNAKSKSASTVKTQAATSKPASVETPASATTPSSPVLPSSAGTPTPSSKLASLLKDMGIVVPTPTATTTTKKAPKSGVYTSVQASNNIPADSTLKDYVNNVFQKYYGRDASQTELQDWLPQLKSQYVGPNGTTKTNIEYTYKNGQLISTKYLTKDNADPKIWLEDKLQTKLASGDVGVNKLNIPEGPTGKYFVALKGLAAQNGIMLSDAAAQDYATKITAGVVDANTAYNTIRESAANAFPSLGEKIKQGIDLKTLADPYIQSMSNILEIPDTGIDLFDPKIRSALAFTTPDGKVGTKSIYDFEKELRQDPRWQYTNNARQQAASVATTVLKDFGFMG